MASSPLSNPKTPEDWKTVVKAQLARRFSYVDKKLQGNNWLMGEDFTVADAYFFTVLGWSKLVGVDLSPWPKIIAYLDRVASRPAVQATLQAEGLT